MSNFALAQSATWNNAAGGSWDDGANWVGGIEAQGTGFGAFFNALDLTADATVTLDSSQTIGTITFSDTFRSHGWTVNAGTPGGSLNFSVASGSPTIDISANTHLTLNATVFSTQGLSKAGDGTITINGNNQFAGTGTFSGNGAVRLGNDGALGLSTGSIVWGAAGTANHGTLIADGGPRTIAPTFVVNSDWFKVSGTNSITFSNTIYGIRANNAILNGLGGGAVLNLQNLATSGDGTARNLTLIGKGNTVINGTISAGTAAGGSFQYASGGTTTLKNISSIQTSVQNGTFIIDRTSGGNLTNQLRMGGLNREVDGSSRATAVFRGAASAGTVTLTGNIDVLSGDSRIVLDPNGGAGIAIANSGTFSRGATNGVLDVRGLGAGSGTIAIGASNLQNGMFPFVTVNSADFATVSGGFLQAFAGYTDVTATVGSGSTTTHRITGSSSSSVALSNTGLTFSNGILVKDAATHTLNIGSGNTLQLGSPNGPLMMASGAGTLTVGSAVNEGVVIPNAGGTGGVGRDLILNNESVNDMIVNSTVTNYAAGATNATVLVKSGDGRVVLRGTNTYSGNTYINGGTLVIDSPAALGTGLVLRVWGPGALDLNGNNVTQAEIVGPGMVTNSSASPSNFNFSPTADRAVSAQLAGNLTFVKNNNNQVQINSLTGNTYTGGTVLNDGRIRLQHGNGLGLGPLVFNADPAGLASRRGMLWTPGTLINPIIPNELHVDAGRAGTIRSEGTGFAAPTFTGALTGSGTLAVSGHGGNSGPVNWDMDASAFTGTILLTTAIDNTGAVTNSQNVYFRNANSGSADAFFQMTSGGSTAGGLPSKGIRWQSALDGTIEMGALASTILTPGTNSTIANDSPGTTATLEIGNLGLSTTWQGSINNNLGTMAVRKVGAGTLTFTGTNTYTGATTVNAGVLRADTALPNTPLTVNGGTLLLNAGAGSASTVVNGGNLVVNASTLNATSAAINGGGTLYGKGGAAVGNTASTGVVVAGGTTAGARGTISTVDQSINTLTLTTGTGATALTVGGAGASDQSALNFELGASNTADKIQLSDGAGGGAMLTNAGGAQVNVTPFGGWSGPGSYTLITAPGGGIDHTKFSVNTMPIGFFTPDIHSSSTANSLVLDIAGSALPTVAFWKGDVNTSWTAGSAANTNWDTSFSGGADTNQLPGGITSVWFNAQSAAGVGSTTLDDARTLGIESLNFGSLATGTVRIGGTGHLALGSTGIALLVQSGSGAHEISVAELALDSSQTWSNNSSNVLTVSSSITGPGGVNVNGSGGTILLSGNNAFSGGVTVTNGAVRLGSDTALGSGNLTMNGGILDLNNRNLTVGALGGSAGVIQNGAAGSATLTFNTAAGSGASSSTTIANGSGVVAVGKAGTGTLVLSGTNSYTGGTDISGGTLGVNADAALGGAAGQVVFSGNATLQPSAASALTLNRQITVNAGVTATLQATQLGGGATNITTVGAIVGDGTLTKSGTGVLVLNSGSSTVANMVLAEGVTQLGAYDSMTSGNTILGSTATLDLNGKTVGAGTLSLLVSGGTLTNSDLANEAVLGSNTVVSQPNATIINMTGSGAIRIDSFWNATPQNINNQYLSKVGSGTLTLGGGLDAPGNLNSQMHLQVGTRPTASSPGFTSGGYVIVNKSSPEEVSGGNVRIVELDSGTIVFGSNVIASSPTFGQIGSLTIGGEGVVDLNGAGGVNATVANAVQTQWANEAGPGDTSFFTIGNWGNGTVLNNNSLQAATLTIGAGNASSGVGSLAANTVNYRDGTGVLALAKTGTGAIALATNNGRALDGDVRIISGNSGNTFSGGLYVNDGTISLWANDAGGVGTLAVGANGNLDLTQVPGGFTFNSSAATQRLMNSGDVWGTVTAPSGRTVGGAGTYNAAVTVQSSANVAPGASVGTMTTAANLSLTSANLLFEIGDGGVDRINADGGLTLSGVSTFAFSDFGLGAPTGTYTLIDYTGTALADLSNFAGGSTVVGRYTVSSLINNTANTSVDVTITSAPIASQWNVDADGSWTVQTNWSGSIPSIAGDTANFAGAILAPRTVEVNGARTVGAITFDNTNSYTLSGSAITLDVASGDAAINVIDGSHVIASPLTLNDDLDLTVSNVGDTLSVSGALTATGRTINKTGAGAAQFENVRAAALNVAGGGVKISAKGSANQAAGTSVVEALSITPGAQLDLTNNSMVVDYTGAAGTLENDIRQHLQSGRLTSSSAAGGLKLGYGDNAVMNKLSFGGLSVESDDLLIKFTYAGDANLDGQVTISDLGDLASNWQSTSAVWRNGDFNYDGQVTISDLGDLASNWQAGVGSPLGMSFQEALAAVGFDGAAVPEPATMGLLGLLGACTLKRARRRF